MHLRPTLFLAAVLALGVAATAPGVASATITGPPQTVASGLSFPWEVLPMPDGRLLVTERPGRVRVIDAGGNLLSQPAYESPGGSFLGLAIHPNYATNKFVYLYNKYSVAGVPKNRIQRFVDNGTTLSLSTTILDGIPGDQTSNGHDGGRIKFGPDGKLYVTTGDTFAPGPPQDLESLAGKILRLNAAGDAQDGSAPSDNPFPSGTNSKFVWSYGHRHPQGIAWDASGQLWETEHGPSGEAHAGGRCCRDELNKIDKGANYGWPAIMGNEQQAGMRSPVVSSGDTVAWAPAGAAFGPDGELYAPGLISQHLRQFSISGGQVTRQREHFRLELGRLRTATYAGGFLYLTTSNNSTNEKVLRVPINSQQQPSTSVVWAVGDANANSSSQATANRITGRIDRFLYLGDVYENGTAAEFANNFDSVWGRFKALANPTPGNHEWSNRATGYDPYWGARAPQSGGGHYYSFSENGWEVLSLNTEESMAPGSPQYEWLQQKLADGGNCRIAFFHRPRYVAPGSHADAPDIQPLWDLMANKVRFVINGHAHAMMRANPVAGITELISGAGGHSHHAANPDPRFAFINTTDFGVLRLKLNAIGSNANGGATVEHDFIATDDGAVLDSSSGTCSPPPPSSSYRDAVLATSGLVSYWRLGESSGLAARDERGANPGTYEGGVSLGQPGALAGDSDTAAGFGGGSSQVRTPYAFGGGGGTIEFWGYATDLGSRSAGVYTADDGSSSYTHQVGVQPNGAVKSYIWDGSARTVVGPAGRVRANEWHHYALVWQNGGSASLYLDGQLQGSVSVGSAWAQGNKFLIGKASGPASGLTNAWQGRLDEVAVYNSAVSAATIQQHYQQGTSDRTPPAAPSGLTAAGGDGRIILDWTDNDERDLDGYDVYRSGSAGGPYTKVNDSRVGTSRYTDTGLPNGTTYYYVVKATDTAGNESPASGEASATPNTGGPSSSYRDAVLATSGLVSYWRLGEGSGSVAADVKGANSGSYVGGVGLGQPGALAGDSDTAAGFGGGSSHVSTPYAFGGGGGTIEFWGYATDLGSRSAGVYTADDGSSSYSHQVGVQPNGAVKSYIWDGSARTVVGPAGRVRANEWHHYALVWQNGGSASLYLDGQLQGSVSVGSAWAQGNKFLLGKAGGAASGLTNAWQGRLDEVAVYNSAVSAATIQQHYQQGTSYRDAVLATSGLVSYWRLGESSGLAARDERGANPGTYEGGVSLGQPGALAGDSDTAAGFGGGSSQVRTPYAFGGGGGTIEFWGYATDLGSRSAGVYTADDGSSSYTHQVGVQPNGAVKSYIWDGSARTVVGPAGRVRANEWHHYALVWQNGGSASLYLDGQLQGSVSVGSAWAQGNKFLIGKASGPASGLTNAWQGRLDEVAVYNSAVSAATIQQHYQQGG